MNSVTITLPFPSPALSPNARGHWAKRAKGIALARERAYIDTCRTVTASHRERWPRAVAAVVFYAPGNYGYDMDNLNSRMKAYWDGIADAGIIADDKGLSHEMSILMVDRKRPRVEITIRSAP